jgi:hypothetical protein
MNQNASRPTFARLAAVLLAATVAVCVTVAVDAQAQVTTLEYAGQQVPYVLQGGLSLTTSVRVQKGATITVRSMGSMCFQNCGTPLPGMTCAGSLSASPDGPLGAPRNPNPAFPAPRQPSFTLLCGVQPFAAPAVPVFAIPTLVHGTQWIECGASPTTFTAPADGWLTFFENDSFPNDNVGTWTITSLQVTQPNYVNNLPPSEPPQVDQVDALTGSVGNFGVESISMDYLGTFAVLPTPGSGGVRLMVHTPYNNTPGVDIDGVALQQNPAGTNPGYFASIANPSTDLISTPIAEWRLNIVPPAGKNTNSNGYTIGLTSLSNGNQISPRATVKLIPRSKAPPALRPSCTSSNQGSAGCGAPPIKQGYTYWGTPDCSLPAFLQCKGVPGGPFYYCCSQQNGTAGSSDCGPGYVEYQPTCPLSGVSGDPNMTFFNPGGCYESNNPQ